MDIQQLHSDIKSTQSADPISDNIANPPNSNWTTDSEGLLQHKNHIYIPDSKDLRLRVLLNKHDHPISGHFSQNKTLKLVRNDYTWPLLRTFVQDYCKSCTTCMRSKPQRHQPYGLLKQLPILERPWNSISMDFIEKLPPSSGFNTILVIIG